MTKADLKSITDLVWREKLVFAPLAAVVLWMGIYPTSFIDIMSASVENLIDNYDAALAASEGGVTLAGLWPGR
jgi:NADH-quinone oxidoreductase subunit M